MTGWQRAAVPHGPHDPPPVRQTTPAPTWLETPCDGRGYCPSAPHPTACDEYQRSAIHWAQRGLLPTLPLHGRFAKETQTRQSKREETGSKETHRHANRPAV